MSRLTKMMGCNFIQADGFVQYQGYLEAIAPATATRKERVKLRYFFAVTGEPTNAEWFPATAFKGHVPGQPGWKTYANVAAANAAEQAGSYNQQAIINRRMDAEEAASRGVI